MEYVSTNPQSNSNKNVAIGLVALTICALTACILLTYQPDVHHFTKLWVLVAYTQIAMSIKLLIDAATHYSEW